MERTDSEIRHRYEYEFDVHSEHAGAIVFRMVGKDKRVLEIGAGPGSITQVLRNLSNCRITAIEIDPEAIDILSQFCERVYQADLNDASWPKVLQKEEPFEIIVAADVLEHLYDPLSTLVAMKQLLHENGCIVVSLPHIGHSSILSCLFEEDFSYREWGLLDRTHIRFFGIKNIQELFTDAGLKIIDAQFVVLRPEETEFAEAWLHQPRRIRDMLSRNRFGMVYQVVVKAVLSEVAGEEISLLSLPVTVPPKESKEEKKSFFDRFRVRRHRE
ncbi:MAG: class I SAM-dependent methyltransferase [Syntrophobacteraceae bacterium]